MPTGSCIKCQTLPILNDSSSKLIIAFEVLELSKKFINYLEDENISYKKEDSLTIIIQTSSLFTFLSKLLSKDIFKKHERESIYLLSLKESEEFNFSNF